MKHGTGHIYRENNVVFVRNCDLVMIPCGKRITIVILRDFVFIHAPFSIFDTL